MGKDKIMGSKHIDPNQYSIVHHKLIHRKAQVIENLTFKIKC
jgi:hypothetical protein